MRPLSFIVFMTAFLLTAATLSAVNNPNVQSPVGSPTAVPSASRSGLVPSRPFATTGSGDIVSGHVGGMRHFRGVMPYSSSNIFSGPRSTSPVDAFLRRSYDPILHDRSPGMSRSYDDPRRTFTSAVRADGSGLFSPTITSQGQTDPYIPPMLAQTLDTQYRQRPLSLTGSELEKLMGRQMQLREEIQRQRETTDEKDAAIVEDIRKESPFFQDYLRLEELTPHEETPDEKSRDHETVEGDKEAKPLPEEKVLETFRQEEYEKALQDEPPSRTSELLRPQTDSFGAEDSEEQPEELTPEDAQRRAAEKAQTQSMLSRYGDFERLAAARIAEYLAAAEAFLREGRFYKAADAFALAAVWGPDDVRTYVGQAVSLFAAGEYMSSAYLLRQAILKNPKVASEKISPSELIGDRDIYENRLIEAATWQQRSGSGELAFLIAYMMHHDGKSQQATEAIRIADEKMPDDKAVVVLKQVIVPGESAR